jgi:hypothetical protein
VLVTVAEVVLAELPRAVAEFLQQLSERGVALIEAYRRARMADGVQTGSDRQLAGDEGRARGGAARLRVVVGEEDAFAADAVDVRRGHHHAVAVDAHIRVADVVGHDHQDVGTRRGLRERRSGKDADEGGRQPQAAPMGSGRAHLRCSSGGFLRHERKSAAEPMVDPCTAC